MPKATTYSRWLRINLFNTLQFSSLLSISVRIQRMICQKKKKTFFHVFFTVLVAGSAPHLCTVQIRVVNQDFIVSIVAAEFNGIQHFPFDSPSMLYQAN